MASIELGASASSLEAQAPPARIEAAALDIGDTVVAHLSADSHDLWFRVLSRDFGYLSVGVESEETLAAEILEEWEQPGSGSASRSVVPNVEYLVHLSSTSVDDSVEFKLTVQFHPDSDWNEPNDQPERASRLIPGQTLNGVLLPAGDRDYFRLHTYLPSYIVPNLEPQDSTTIVLVGSSDVVLDPDKPFYADSGTHIFRVDGANGQPYRIAVQLIPVGDDLPPRDTSDVVLDSVYFLRLYEKEPSRFARLEIREAGILHTRTARVGLVRGEMGSLLNVAKDPDDIHITVRQGSTASLGRFVRVKPGPAVVGISADGHGDLRPTMLSFTVVPQEEEAEASTSIRRARDLSLGSLNVLTIIPTDTLYFRITIDKADTLHFLASHQVGPKPDVSLLDDAAEKLHTFLLGRSAKDMASRMFAVSEGLYYLRVTGDSFSKQIAYISLRLSSDQESGNSGTSPFGASSVRTTILAVDSDPATRGHLRMLVTVPSTVVASALDSASVSEALLSHIEVRHQRAWITYLIVASVLVLCVVTTRVWAARRME